MQPGSLNTLDYFPGGVSIPQENSLGIEEVCFPHTGPLRERWMA